MRKCSNCGVELRLNDRFCSQCGQPAPAAQEAGEPDLVRSFGENIGGVTAVACAADGRTAVSGGADHIVRLWDVESGRELAAWAGHTGAVTAVAFSPDCLYVASGADAQLRLWSVATGEPVRMFEGHTWVVTSVAFSPDGGRLLSSSWDKSVRVWDVGAGTELARLDGHENYVTGAAFFPDGEYAFTCSHDGTLRAWDLVLKREAGCLRSPSPAMYGCLALSPDGKSALVGTHEAELRLFDTETGRPLARFSGYDGVVSSVAFTPDGRRILSAGDTDYLANEQEPKIDNTVRLWDAASATCLKRFEGHRAGVQAVACMPDGRHALSASRDGTLRLWALPG